MTSTKKCIYCGEPIDPSRGEGDHIIPAAFARLPAAGWFLSRVRGAVGRGFYRNGSHATGIDRILGEPGVAEVTLHKHFKSRKSWSSRPCYRRPSTWTCTIA